MRIDASLIALIESIKNREYKEHPDKAKLILPMLDLFGDGLCKFSP
jgi:hypothetical protein